MVGKVMPDAFDNENMIGMESTSNSTGDGKIKREEDIKMKLAAMITQVLPNGNFVIRGKQEVRVNFELRELTLDGVIRPEDVLNNNSISYEKIAEARISYGGPRPGDRYPATKIRPAALRRRIPLLTKPRLLLRPLLT
jgi:flagellar L-ring protein precursor FlgH